MSAHRRRNVALGVLLALIAGSGFGLLWVRDYARVESVAQIGHALPPLRLTDLEGHPVSFDQYRGKKFLAVFIMVGCGHCEAQLKILEKIHQDRARDGLLMVAVSDDAPTETAAFFRQHPVPYPVWVDPRRGFYKKLGKFTVPSLFLIDETGILRQAADGYQSFQKAQKMVSEFLEDGRASSAKDKSTPPEPPSQVR